MSDSDVIDVFQKYCAPLKVLCVKEAIEKIARDKQSDPPHPSAVALSHIIVAFLRNRIIEAGVADTVALLGSYTFDFVLIQSIEDVCASFEKALRACREPLYSVSSTAKMIMMEKLICDVVKIAYDSTEMVLALAIPNTQVEFKKVTQEVVEEPVLDPLDELRLIAKHNMDLCTAARDGDLEMVKSLHKQGANIHYHNDSPMMCAASNGHVKVVKYLHFVGSDTHFDNDQALRRAACGGHLKVVKFLVAHGAFIGAAQHGAIRSAAGNGHPDVVHFLFMNGADVHAMNDYALRTAAANGHLSVVVYLVACGANLHALDNEAIRSAAMRGHLEVVKLLHANGANIHARNDECLHLAEIHKHQAVVDYIQSLTKDKATQSATK